jgi:hypothetical protein
MVKRKGDRSSPGQANEGRKIRNPAEEGGEAHRKGKTSGSRQHVAAGPGDFLGAAVKR